MGGVAFRYIETRVIARGEATERLTPSQGRAAHQRLRRFEDRCAIVPVSDEIFRRVGRRFPVEPIRTLDAVHIATLEMLREPPQSVAVVTRDRRVRDNARALGYAVE